MQMVSIKSKLNAANVKAAFPLSCKYSVATASFNRVSYFLAGGKNSMGLKLVPITSKQSISLVCFFTGAFFFPAPFCTCMSFSEAYYV